MEEYFYHCDVCGRNFESMDELEEHEYKLHAGAEMEEEFDALYEL